jgi:hypothetical protein
MAESKTRRRRRSTSSSSSSSSSAKSSRRSGGTSSRRSGGTSSKESSSSKSSSSAKRSSAASNANHAKSARDVVVEAVGQLQELIGRPVESVTGVEKNGREWKLSVEVLELERVPNTTDVLGRYEITMDQNGELTGARRTRRYARAEAGED